MATAPIISQSVQVELPDSVQSQEVSNEDKVPVILEVQALENMRFLLAENVKKV